MGLTGRDGEKSLNPPREPRSRYTRWTWLVLAACVASGCSEPAQFRLNEVELLKLQYQQNAKDELLDSAKAQDVVDILAALFGTPDDPRFPNLSGDGEGWPGVIDVRQLRRAAGPVSSDREGVQRGLYREHCAQCHGISGDGAGPTSAFLNPYPRDFRLGKFKYKSTKLGQRPLDADLRRTILDGIPGTGMPSFRTLPEEDVNALIEYVKYLAIRGRVEYKLLGELAVLDPDESLVDWELRAQAEQASQRGDANADDLKSKHADQLTTVMDIVFDEVELWHRRRAAEIPPIPDWLLSRADPFAANANLGRELFSGKANCAQCHGQTGLGDGQTENFDDWTNQWLKGANVDARDAEACAPFIAVGAFPPRAVRPRNLRTRVYRGGDRFADLYRRIANGIEGTGMPDSAALTEEEIWALVAYVVNLPYETQAANPPQRTASGVATIVSDRTTPDSDESP
jgi:mono/diheme cytochrome c family protein